MCVNFDDFWTRAVPFLQKRIREENGKLEMPNWSVAGRPNRETIPITNADADGITCLTKDRKPIHATREDLEYTYSVWDRYKNGSVLRKEIRDEIGTSTYTICTIHYLEENGNKE